MKSPPALDAARADVVTWYHWYVVLILCLINILNFVDRKMPLILVEAIKRDLGLSDTQIGLIAGPLFTGVYGVAGLVVARLADRGSRRNLIAFCVAGWSILTAAGGLARGFVDFALSRVGVAVAESGGSSPAHAMIADYFPAHRRGLALGLFLSGSSIGSMLGLMIGGWINDFADWRTAMFVVMVPGLVLTIVLFLTVREPQRRAVQEDGKGVGFRQTLVYLCGLPTFRWLAVAAMLASAAGTAITAFGPAYFIRMFGLSASEVGWRLGLALGAGSALGTVAAGFFADRVGRKAGRSGLVVPAIAYAITTPLIGFVFATERFDLAFLVLVPALMLTAFFVAPTYSTVQDLSPGESRATSAAILFLATQGIGASLGPLMAGVLSDLLRPVSGEQSLRHAMLAFMPVLAGSAFCYWRAAVAMSAAKRSGAPI